MAMLAEPSSRDQDLRVRPTEQRINDAMSTHPKSSRRLFVSRHDDRLRKDSEQHSKQRNEDFESGRIHTPAACNWEYSGKFQRRNNRWESTDSRTLRPLSFCTTCSFLLWIELAQAGQGARPVNILTQSVQASCYDCHIGKYCLLFFLLNKKFSNSGVNKHSVTAMAQTTSENHLGQTLHETSTKQP